MLLVLQHEAKELTVGMDISSYIRLFVKETSVVSTVIPNGFVEEFPRLFAQSHCEPRSSQWESLLLGAWWWRQSPVAIMSSRWEHEPGTGIRFSILA